MNRKRIGIIGGGYAGLTAAYELQKQGHAVTVLEKNSRWGGQAATLPLLDTHIEHFYHHLFGSDSYILGLMDELGLGDQLRWIESKVGFYYDGQIYDFVTPLDLLRFTALLIDKAQIGVCLGELRDGFDCAQICLQGLFLIPFLEVHGRQVDQGFGGQGIDLQGLFQGTHRIRLAACLPVDKAQVMIGHD